MVRQDNSFLQRSTHERFGDLKERVISSVQDTTAKKKNKLLLSSIRSKVFSQSEDLLRVLILNHLNKLSGPTPAL